MYIDRVDLIAFGGFTNRSLDLSHGPTRFHLVFGPNESGKSTCLRAITAWLFGHSHLTNDDYVHPMTKMRVGGRIVDSEGSLQCIRRRGRTGTLRDAEDKATIDESRLQAFLGGIDRVTFETRFGLSHAELLRGGQQILRGEGEVGEILFAAGAGIGKLQEIEANLNQEVVGLFRTRGASTIGTQIKQIDDRRRKLRQLQVPPAEYEARQLRVKEIESQLESLNIRQTEGLLKRNRLQNVLSALPLIPRRQTILNSLNAARNARILAEDFGERRRNWYESHRMAEVDRERLTNGIDQLEKELSSFGDDAVVRQFESEIESTYRELATREKALADANGLRDVASKVERTLLTWIGKFNEISQSIPDAELTTQINAIRISDTAREAIRTLANQFEKRLQQREDAHERLQQLQRQLQAPELVLDDSDLGDPEVFTRALDEVGAPQRLLDAATSAVEKVKSWRQRCDSLHHRLGISVSLESSVEWALPDDEAILRCEVALADHQDTVDNASKAVQDTLEQMKAVKDRISELTSDGKVPSRAELSKARIARDRQLDDLKQSLELCTTENLSELQAKIQVADSLSDSMYAHHEQILRIESEQALVKSLSHTLQHADADFSKRTLQLEHTRSEWMSLWKPLDITVGPPSKMRSWKTDFKNLQELFIQLRESEQEKSLAIERIRIARDRLVMTLDPQCGTSNIGLNESLKSLTQDLLQQYNQTLVRRNELTKQRQAIAENKRLRQQLERDLQEATRQAEVADQALHQWHIDWVEATRPLTAGKLRSTTEVNSMLDIAKDIESEFKSLRVLETRIHSIGDDFTAYQQTVARLNHQIEAIDEIERGTALGTTLEATSATVCKLYQRLQQERSTRPARASLKKQLQACRTELEGKQQESRRLAVVAQQLCEEAGCDFTEDLIDRERLSDAHRAELRSLKEIDEQLLILAADQTLDVFLESLVTHDIETARVEFAKIEEELQRIKSQFAQTHQQLGVARHELEQIDGGNQASLLSQQIQLDLGRLRREAITYIRLKLAQTFLNQAIEHYRQENQGPILASAEDYFRILTCDEYQALKVDFDSNGTPLLHGVRGNVNVAAPAMSTGTADALYLALRLASLQHQLSHGKTIPLIVDDCLIQLDDARSAAALQVFSKLAATTQVILFTHHKHLIDIATQSLSEGAFHVLRL